MKRMLLGALAIAALTFTACNNNSSNASHESHDTLASHDEHAGHDHAAAKDESVAEIKPSFTNVDPAVAASFKALAAQYLQLKNNLTEDNTAGAAKSGEAMAGVLASINKSAMTAEQQKLYAENEDDLREHAEHIGKNNGNIAHQREHFAQMSEDMYALVKAFGAGQPLYHDHCPMYDDNKGAMWLSETQEVKNPYFGQKMAGCGAVKEIIK
ncbi:DUF3347 domain-containing protein [Chitinophaga sp. Hz27]|uniref:DUF3347 domain-containing protein n=1 Tax=Chitinophaga sp. Hz27 TaxID=3347169 RepID=UPI0035E11B7A